MRLMEAEADALVRLGRAGATFFCSTKNIAFADVRMGEHVLTLPLASREFQEWLGHQYFRETNKAPKLTSERDALRTLAAFAKIASKAFLVIADGSSHGLGGNMSSGLFRISRPPAPATSGLEVGFDRGAGQDVKR
jgi:hypothetical protein